MDTGESVELKENLGDTDGEARRLVMALIAGGLSTVWKLVMLIVTLKLELRVALDYQ